MLCMLLPMTAVVLKMQRAFNLDGANIETSSVITAHVIGMFLTGFLTRIILPRIGPFFTILLGFGTQAVGNVLALTVPDDALWVEEKFRKKIGCSVRFDIQKHKLLQPFKTRFLFQIVSKSCFFSLGVLCSVIFSRSRVESGSCQW